MHTTNRYTTNRLNSQVNSQVNSQANSQDRQNHQNNQPPTVSTAAVAKPMVRVASHGFQKPTLRRSVFHPLASVALPSGFAQASPVLAMGSEGSSTVCWVQNGRAIVSQPVGSLQASGAVDPEQPLFDLALKLFEQSGVIATSHQPSRRSRKLMRKLAKILAASEQRLSFQTVQHHHAHVAACLVENQCPLYAPAVLGIALDEFGYSENGTLWGGEFLLTDYRHCQRVGTFKPVSLLEEGQIEEGQNLDRPWRNTYSHLIAAFDWEDLQAVYGELELLQFFNQQPRPVLSQLLMQRLHAPLTSSVSRLFDAVAAAIGICRGQPIHTGQGSAALAALVQPEHLEQAIDSAYQFELRYLGRETSLPYLESRSMWQALLEDLLQNTPTALIAARFHLGLSQAIEQMVSHLHCHYAFTQVALTGSVFENPILLQQVSRCLSHLGLTVLTHRFFPCSHADLLLGQAAIAAARSV